MDERFAERLTELRKAHGYSQEQLGEKLFVSRQAVSKWECGEAVPDVDNLTALADLYGITVDGLLRGSPVVAADRPKKRFFEAPHSALYSWVSCVLMLVPFIMLFVWLLFLPDTVPVHYNASGVADRWGSKFEMLLLPATSVLIAGVLFVSGLVVKRRVKGEECNKLAFCLFLTGTAMYVMIIVMTAVFTAQAQAIAGTAEGVNFYAVISSAASAIFMLLGASVPFAKPNFLVGVRTNATLSDPVIWRKTNIICGAMFLAAGAGICIFDLLYSGSFINAIVFAATMLVVSVVGALVPKMLQKKNRHTSDNK